MVTKKKKNCSNWCEFSYIIDFILRCLLDNRRVNQGVLSIMYFSASIHGPVKGTKKWIFSFSYLSYSMDSKVTTSKNKNRIFFLMVDAIAKRFPIFHALGLFFFPSSILIRSSHCWIGIYFSLNTLFLISFF
jgi:hypothetical protein